MTDKDFFAKLDIAVAAAQDHGYGFAMVARVLGEHGLSAANARNYAAANWYATRNPDREITDADLAMVRGLYLRESLSRPQWEVLFGSELTAALERSGVLASGRIQADIRPVLSPQHGGAEILLISDPDASAEVQAGSTDHVPGAGNASMSLLNVVPPLNFTAPKGELANSGAQITEVLDLGCGSGVLSLVLATAAQGDGGTQVRVTGTDISQRALAFAELGRAGVLRGVEEPENSPANVEWLQGSWFEPVQGRKFDLIVSNPPFVMAPPQREGSTTYRESGLELDGASALVVSETPQYLTPGGRAHVLAGWALADGESTAHRVSSWLPDTGVRAWVVQRETVDTAEYVKTWLTDEGIDVRSEAGHARMAEWLNYLSSHGVTQIGMGYVHLEKLEESQASEITFEVMEQSLPAGTFLGPEVAEWFARATWLANTDAEKLLDTRFAIRPGVAIEDVHVANTDQGQGFSPFALRLSRTDGPAWSHDIDAHVRAILSGVHPEGLPLRDVADLYCTVQGLETAEFLDALVPIATDLIRHGFLLPEEFLDS